jgi:hypothetical protein
MGFYAAKTAKAYDKLAANYLAFIRLASIRLTLSQGSQGRRYAAYTASFQSQVGDLQPLP